MENQGLHLLPKETHFHISGENTQKCEGTEMTTKFKRTERLQETKQGAWRTRSSVRVELTVWNGRKISALGLGSRGRELEPYPVSPEELGYTRQAQSGMESRI